MTRPIPVGFFLSTAFFLKTLPGPGLGTSVVRYTVADDVLPLSYAAVGKSEAQQLLYCIQAPGP